MKIIVSFLKFLFSIIHIAAFSAYVGLIIYALFYRDKVNEFHFVCFILFHFFLIGLGLIASYLFTKSYKEKNIIFAIISLPCMAVICGIFPITMVGLLVIVVSSIEYFIKNCIKIFDFSLLKITKWRKL